MTMKFKAKPATSWAQVVTINDKGDKAVTSFAHHDKKQVYMTHLFLKHPMKVVILLESDFREMKRLANQAKSLLSKTAF